MATIKKIQFQGERAVELRTRELRLVATTGRGPRLALLSRRDGENLLYWAPGRHRYGEWDLMGGHRFWLARPGADEAEETYAPDNAACELRTTRDGFTLSPPAIAGVNIARSVTVRAVAANRLTIEHRVDNVGNMLWSGGAWGLTCTLPTPTTTYVIPLSDASTWDTASMTFFKKWGGTHTGSYDDPQFTMTADAVRIRSLGSENKRAFRAAPGIIALHDAARDVLFAKRSEWQRGGVYPMDSNLAVYTGENSFMVEMETMAPLVTLKPGESATHVEEWVLGAATREVPTAGEVVKLFRR